MTLSKEEMGTPHPDLNALAAFTDQRLTGADRASLVAHLAVCAECRTLLATMARGQSDRVPSHARAWLAVAATVTLAVAASFVATRLTDREPIPRDEPVTAATHRGGTRVVNGKTFTFVAGEWIDAAYDPINLLPVQDIADAAARTALLQRTPALAPYASLGPNVTVVLDGTVYKFRR